MSTQTLYKNGNSIAVTVPRQYLKQLHLKEGSEVIIEKEGNELHIKPKAKVLVFDVDARFMKMLDEFIHKHEDVLKTLANK